MKDLNCLRDELVQRDLGPYFDALKPLAKNALHITLQMAQEDAVSVGVSKFGGMPDLPQDMPWPYTGKNQIPMSFVAQVNFAEAAPYDLEHKLPDRGMLYFFYDCSKDGMPWGFDPADCDGWKVCYADADASSLVRTRIPEDLLPGENGEVFGEAQICFEACMELPTTESDLVEAVELPDDADMQDAYWEWLDESGEELRNKLLGHADVIQSGMELECEYVTNQIYCGNPDGYAAARERGLDKNAARWNLLMQIDSNEELGMMWGDMGRLYLWITTEDLKARKFENCWLILQCC